MTALWICVGGVYIYLAGMFLVLRNVLKTLDNQNEINHSQLRFNDEVNKAVRLLGGIKPE